MAQELLLLLLIILSSSQAFSAMNSNNMKELVATATAYASAHGILVASKSASAAAAAESSLTFQGAPISLLPNALPRRNFEQAQDYATTFNRLVDVVSRDAEFLKETLGGSVSTADPYTGRLLEMYQKLYIDESSSSFASQADRLGIQRSDYMLQDQNANFKQVELNTIASSFAGLSQRVTEWHQYATQRFPTARKFVESNIPPSDDDSSKSESNVVPDSNNLQNLAQALALARNRANDQGAVLMVVQPDETNTVDQRLLELQLWKDHQIPVFRRSLAQIAKEARVTTDGQLVIILDDDSIPISVVYFRAGYAPTDYPSETEWEARELLENSLATKCPCLGYQLAGTKKVQQALARPGVVEAYGVASVRPAFAGLYALGPDATETDRQVVAGILQDPALADQYVLKPQREGGGYNFYNERLYEKLSQHARIVDDDDSRVELDAPLAEYILMERLFPPAQEAILLRKGQFEGQGACISEFGCFGTILADADGQIVHNAYAGFLLRTKFQNVDEGGVASGFATLSSPYLY